MNTIWWICELSHLLLRILLKQPLTEPVDLLAKHRCRGAGAHTVWDTWIEHCCLSYESGLCFSCSNTKLKWSEYGQTCALWTPPTTQRTATALQVQLLTSQSTGMMKMSAGVAASSAAGRCDLRLCWQSCQELSGCIHTDCSAVHWHFIAATRITVDLLFPLIVWQPCDIFTSQPRDASTGTKTRASWVNNEARQI